MGLLTRQSLRDRLRRRTGAIAGVAVLHALVIAGLLQMRQPPPAELVPAAIQVVNLSVEAPDEPPVPDLPLQVQLPSFEVVVPVVQVQIQTPVVTTITSPPVPVTVAAPAPAPVAARNDGPVMLEVDQVAYVKMPAPRYPRAARQARLQGTVLLWVLIDTEGHPSEVRIHRSSGYAQLDREARDAVMKALFKPLRRNGEALWAQAIVPIDFSLTVRTAHRG